jgi:hypothetical protein
MRLFRQSESDNWKPVFSAMEKELQPLLSGYKDNTLMKSEIVEEKQYNEAGGRVDEIHRSGHRSNVL